MDYKATAKGVLTAIGGKDNLVSAAHCATRLRLVISNNGKVRKSELENVDGVKGVFEAAGQLQIIIGTGAVNKVYDEFIALAGVSAASKDDVKQAAAAKQPIAKRAIKTLGDIFVPIIPAIVASGLLMGLMEGFTKIFPALAESGTYTVFHLFSNAAFVFLPILIAFSAARAFGGNPFLGAVIGMIMIHPDLLNAWAVAGADKIPSVGVWFNLYHINLVGYQGHVIPVVIAVWFMSMLEKKLHKIVPEMIDLFVTPLVTVLVTGYLTLTVFGPIFSWLESGVLTGMQTLIAIPFGIGAALCGAVYAPTVVAGIHHMYNALEAGMLSSTGINTWMPIATAANVAQGAAALAFGLKTRNRKSKAVALPASLSAFLGITEPAIFGVNLRYVRPFFAGCAGGAAGALVAGWLHVGATAYGITGLFGILITTQNLMQYLLVMLVAFGVAFTLTFILYRDEDTPAQPAPYVTATPVVTGIASPLSGEVIPMSEVPDDTFASGVLGGGVAILPSEGKIVAPADATVSMLPASRHAVGLTLDDGTELLIHIGINTVELKGEGFTALVREGDKVNKGQTILTFDPAYLTAQGYSIITPVIVTDGADNLVPAPQAHTMISALAPLLTQQANTVKEPVYAG